MKVATELSIRILTHNIRYATTAPFKGEQPWAERKQLLINELLFNTRNQNAFICLQEVLHNQLVDVLSGLNSSPTTSWNYIGVGRDDGYQAGEYSAIIYRPQHWEINHWETVWLSETPDVPSKSWDAASIRIVTIGVFTHRTSRQTVLAMNTHLDDQGARSRLEAARIILRKISQYSAGDYGDDFIDGVFLAGDFNSQDFEEAYVELTAPGSPLADAAMLVPAAEHYGNRLTWTGFGYEGQGPTRIDYVLLGNGTAGGQAWAVDGYAVLANRFDDGVYNSDHRAVVVDGRLVLVRDMESR